MSVCQPSAFMCAFSGLWGIESSMSSHPVTASRDNLTLPLKGEISLEMITAPDSDISTPERLQLAQLEKLELEIRDLKKRRHVASKLTDWIPIITAVIAVAGFLFGVYRLHD